MDDLIDFTVLILMYFVFFFRKWRVRGRGILLVNTLMYIYLTLVLYFTLMPVIASLPHLFNHSYVPMNLTPFIDLLARHGDFLRQIILNVVMTVPFGFLFPLTNFSGSDLSSASLIRTVSACFLMSLGIELLQPLISGLRSSDITDIITNVLGGAIGYGLYILFRPVIMRVLKHLKSHAAQQAE